MVYSARFIAIDHYGFDYGRLLANSEALHKHVIHIYIDDLGFRVTVPAVLGIDGVTDLLLNIAHIAHVTSARHGISDYEQEQKKLKALAKLWPEYVLEPYDPLGFLTPDMDVPFFNLSI